MHTMEIKNKALALRQTGMAITNIATELAVAKSTVSLWVKKVKLTDAQRKCLQDRGRVEAMRAARVKQYTIRRNTWRDSGAKSSSKELDQLALLYWAEGTKSSNDFRFANADAQMLILVKSCVEKIMPNACFTISIRAYTNNGLTREDIQNHWLIKLGLTASCLRGCSFENPTKEESGKGHGKLLYGVCHLRVCKSAELINMIYGYLNSHFNTTF